MSLALPDISLSYSTGILAPCEAGTLFRTPSGLFYRAFIVEDQDTVEGYVCEYASADGTEVTTDRAGGSAITGLVAGIAAAAITDGYLGFFQVSGRGAHDLLTDNAIAEGDRLIPHASTDGGTDEIAITSTAPTNAEIKILMSVFGMALADDDSLTQDAASYIIAGIL